jgi:uncharacterized cupredoxin-like copper-binding protein
MQRTEPSWAFRWRVVASAFALALALVAAGCGEDDPETSDPGGDSSGDSSGDSTGDVQTIEVEVTGGGEAGEGGEHTFHAHLSDVSAGPVKLALTNNGQLEHHAQLWKLNEGETLESVMAAGAEDPTLSRLASLITGYGGPKDTPPGETSVSTQTLDAGEYLLICVIAGEDGLPHAAHGMAEQFTVSEGEGETDSDPDADTDADDADITLADFSFTLPESLPAGGTVTVVNEGEQIHEVAMLRPEAGLTQDDVAAALEQPPGPDTLPRPWRGAGGIGALSPGRSATFEVPDEPGDYVLVCEVPDITGDKRPHHTHGMIQTVTVE